MKTLTILFVMTFAIQSFGNELQWVDDQINAIKPPRAGISKARINAIKSPFITLKTSSKKGISKKTKNTTSTPSKKNTVKKQSTVLNLQAIINQSALVNGKWYKLNDKIGKYTLHTVNRKNVILLYKKKELLLSTAKKTRNLKFKSN